MMNALLQYQQRLVFTAGRTLEANVKAKKSDRSTRKVVMVAFVLKMSTPDMLLLLYSQ
jgi:hypothetical protein